VQFEAAGSANSLLSLAASWQCWLCMADLDHLHVLLLMCRLSYLPTEQPAQQPNQFFGELRKAVPVSFMPVLAGT
jgi:hypothetical protein